MSRARISTTVDRDRLEEARRRLAGSSDSEVIDRALTALLDQLAADHERRALTERPYELDAELSWEAPDGPVLPYDGEVPPEVLELAAARRASRARGTAPA